MAYLFFKTFPGHWPLEFLERFIRNRHLKVLKNQYIDHMPLFQSNIKILDLEIPSNPSVTHPPFSFSGVLIAPKYIFIFPHGPTLVPQCRTLFYLGFISTYLQLVALFDLLFALRNISYLFILKPFPSHL